MAMVETMRKDWARLSVYGRYEYITLRIVLILLVGVTAYTLVSAAMQLIHDLGFGGSFADKAALQDTFGSILTVLILIEFSHSVYVATSTNTGAVQVRIVVLIAILVIARKLMLLDYASVTTGTLLGFGGLLLALGALYWLICHGDRFVLRTAGMFPESPLESTRRDDRGQA